LAGPQGAILPWPDAGAHGLAAGPHGAMAGLALLDAGAHGLPMRFPLDAGPQGLMAPCPPAGAQGLLCPHGLRMCCANCIGLSAAATGVGAGTVAAIAAASVDRPAASNVDFKRLDCMNFSFWPVSR
jgi:hypothetical protein